MAKYDDTDWTARQKAEARQMDREFAAEMLRIEQQAQREQREADERARKGRR